MGEEAVEGEVADIEAACIGAKGGHDEGLAVADEAAPSDRAPAGTTDARAGVEVARDFASYRAGRFVRENQAVML